MYVGGMRTGRFSLKLPGEHNVRNAVAAIAAVSQDLEFPPMSYARRWGDSRGCAGDRSC